MAIKAYSYAKDGNRKLSANFAVKEFRCKDGSDPIFIDDELVTLLQALGSLVHLGVEVVGVDVQGKADLLEFNHFLVLLGFLFLFQLFEAEFAVIHDLAYRRNSLRRNFYQIQILFCRKLLSVPCGHKTELTSVGTDYSDFLVTDFFIDLKLLAILVSYGEHPQNIKLNYK